MFRYSGLTAILLCVAALGGCSAGGPAYSEVAGNIPSIEKDQGRIIFFREAQSRQNRLNPYYGGGVRPAILVDGKPVGTSIPGGFFFVDLPPGDHAVRLQQATSRKQEKSITLAEGDELYIETWPLSGAGEFVIPIGLVVHKFPRSERLKELRYTGVALEHAR